MSENEKDGGAKLTRPSTDMVLLTGDTNAFRAGDGGGRAAGYNKVHGA